MTEEIMYKYLNFLKYECTRHSNDNYIKDDEINQLEIEIEKFLKELKSSSISNQMKSAILKLDFNLNENNHHKSKYLWLKLLGGFFGKEFSKQSNRENRFEKLSNDIDNLIIELKLI